MIFQPISEKDSLCQGDILSIKQRDGSDHLAIIVTADCDIAQSKFGRYLTYLPIVDVDVFLRDIWAPGKLRDVRNKAASAAVEIIWPVEQARDPEVDRLNEADLIEWVGSAGVDEVLGCFPLATEKNAKLRTILSVLRYQNDPLIDSLQELSAVWNIQGVSPQQQKSHIRSALTQLRSDFFFLPIMPDNTGIGFVILLRDIQSLDANSVFRSHFEFASREQPPQLYGLRVGRFSDNLKYGIVQRFSTLFARIGFETHFEDECALSVELLLETVG